MYLISIAIPCMQGAGWGPCVKKTCMILADVWESLKGKTIFATRDNFLRNAEPICASSPSTNFPRKMHILSPFLFPAGSEMSCLPVQQQSLQKRHRKFQAFDHGLCSLLCCEIVSHRRRQRCRNIVSFCCLRVGALSVRESPEPLVFAGICCVSPHRRGRGHAQPVVGLISPPRTQNPECARPSLV